MTESQRTEEMLKKEKKTPVNIELYLLWIKLKAHNKKQMQATDHKMLSFQIISFKVEYVKTSHIWQNYI